MQLFLVRGGSARAVLYALCSKGVRRIVLINRNEARAKKLAREFRKLFKKTEIEAKALGGLNRKEVLKEADLVVNTTSVGLKTKDKALLGLTDIPIRGKKQKVFFDLIYKPKETAFLKLAKKRGHRTVNGAGMLAYQGARSLEYWTGKKAPMDYMKLVLLNELEK